MSTAGRRASSRAPTAVRPGPGSGAEGITYRRSSRWRSTRSPRRPSTWGRIRGSSSSAAPGTAAEATCPTISSMAWRSTLSIRALSTRGSKAVSTRATMPAGPGAPSTTACLPARTLPEGGCIASGSRLSTGRMGPICTWGPAMTACSRAPMEAAAGAPSAPLCPTTSRPA